MEGTEHAKSGKNTRGQRLADDMHSLLATSGAAQSDFEAQAVTRGVLFPLKHFRATTDPPRVLEPGGAGELHGVARAVQQAGG